MSISNLLTQNKYKIFAGDVVADDLEIANMTCDNMDCQSLTYDGSAPKGTILAGNSTVYEEHPIGADGYILKSRPADPLGLRWEAPAAGDGSIYDNDGTLAGTRNVDCSANDLSFTNVGTLSVTGATTNIATSALTVNGSANQGSLLTGDGTTYDSLTLGANDTVLIADNTQPRGMRWGTLPSDISIYTADGTLTDDRIVDCDFYSMTFGNCGDVIAIGESDQKITQEATDAPLIQHDIRFSATSADEANMEFQFGSSGNKWLECQFNRLASADRTVEITAKQVKCDSDELQVENPGVASIKHVLTTAPGIEHDSEFSASGATTVSLSEKIGGNEYLGVDYNSAAPASRAITLTGGTIDLDGDFRKNGLAQQGSLLKGTGTSYDTFLNGAANTYLKVNGAGTDLEWGAVPAATNLFNSDGTLTSDRTITGGIGIDLSLQSSDFIIDSTGKKLRVKGSLDQLLIGQDLGIGTFAIDRGLPNAQIEIMPTPTTRASLYLGRNATEGGFIAGGTTGVSPKPLTLTGTTLNLEGAIKVNTTGELTLINKTIVGENAACTQNDSVSIGQDATCNTIGSVVVGHDAVSGPFVDAISTRENVVIGDNASCTSQRSVVLGKDSTSTSSLNVAIGYGCGSSFNRTIAMGASVTGITGPEASGSAQFHNRGIIAPAGSKMRFWNQIVSDSAWRLGGTTLAGIDNDGHITRANGTIPMATIRSNLSYTRNVVTALTYYEAVSGTALTSNNGSFASAKFDEPANGRIRYLGPENIIMNINCSCSVQTPNAGDDWFFQLRKNGTTVIAQWGHDFNSNNKQNELNYTVANLITTNDYVSLWVTCDKNNKDMTWNELNITITSSMIEF